MYQTSAGTVMATGMLVTENGWTVTGWGLIAVAVIISAALTAKCLHRRKEN